MHVAVVDFARLLQHASYLDLKKIVHWYNRLNSCRDVGLFARFQKMKKEKKTQCLWNVRLTKLLVHSSKPMMMMMMMNFLNRCVLIHARTHAYTMLSSTFEYAFVFLYVKDEESSLKFHDHRRNHHENSIIPYRH